MTRIRVLLLAVLFLLLAAGVYADYATRGDDVYPVNRPIAKIYSSRYGYKIVFLREDSEYGVFYVPLGWFGRAGGQGEIVWGADPAYPSFTAFYVDGKFSHIRLYLLSDMDDETWGVLRADEAESKKFDVETLDIEY